MLGYGLRQGLDFRGGTMMRVTISANPPIDGLRQVLSKGLQAEDLVQETQTRGEIIIGTEQAGHTCW